MIGKNLWTNKRNHQPLKRIFPLISVRFDVSTKFFEGDQMRNFVNQRYQKLVFIQTGVDRYFVFSAYSFSVIAMTRHAFVHDFKVNFVSHNKFENWFYGVFRNVFRKCIAHLKISLDCAREDKKLVELRICR